MGVQSSMTSKVLLRLVIGVLTIISLEGWVEPTKVIYGSCKPADCDDVMKGDLSRNDTKSCCRPEPPLKVGPFWAELVRHDFGYLKSISEFEKTGNACFAPSKQPPRMPFPLNLAFLRNCTSFPKGDYPHHDSICPTDCTDDSYVALMLGRPEYVHVNWSGCASRVIVPVEYATDDSDKTEDEDFGEKVKQGFRLEWNLTSVEDCLICAERGGDCNIKKDGSLLCLCKEEGPYKCKRGKDHAPLKIGLGSGIGALAIVLLCSCIYVIRRKRKLSLIFRSRHSSSDSSLRTDVEGGNGYFAVPIFTTAELEKATNHFDSSRELGDGAFGTVYHGKLKDGREVAVKRLYEHNYRRVKQFMTEVEILTRLHHKNLVSLYGCTSRQSRELLLVYEYIPNGTVADHLHGERAKQDPLRWPTRISIAIETAAALAYLHASDIIHRDVKTNNILLDDNFCVKVADFGLSRLFPSDVSHVSTAPQGTPGYVDPEYHQCYQLTEKSDVYSFGVVLVELISSMPAVDISRDRHEINLANLAISKIQNHAFHELIDPSLGFELDPEVNRMTMAVAELAFTCLHQEKDVRPSMATVLEELKAILSGTHEPDKSKDVSNDSSTCQSKTLPPLPEFEDAELLKNMESLTSPVSVTQKWGSSGSSSVLVVDM